MLHQVAPTVGRAARAGIARGAGAAMSGAPRASIATSPARAAAASDQPAMFCFQCEQTEFNTGCTTVGVCGKTPEAAAIQDLIVHTSRGIAELAVLTPPDERTNRLVREALFSTLTNVNFDVDALAKYTNRLVEARDHLRTQAEEEGKLEGANLTDAAVFKLEGTDAGSQVLQGMRVGVMAKRGRMNEDLLSLEELITYGVKGVAAYAHHASTLGKTDDFIMDTVYAALAMTAKPEEEQDVDALVAMTLKVGEANVHAMKALNEGHIDRFGTPEPTPVPTKPVEGKAILVSGHDVYDLHRLLEQTEGKGINVYTHGEMLPSHAYPALKKFEHLKGNFGGAWQNQKTEFAEFPGPILMTSNCIVEPRPSYRDRIFTMNAVGFEGLRHLEPGDFEPLIQSALENEGFTEEDVEDAEDNPTIATGFGHDAILGIADKIIEAVDTGKLRHFFVIGGCDGTEGERSYYHDFARATPEDTVIMTLGCGKYRFIKEMGEMGTLPGVDPAMGIPRVLDVGQCNDAYSAVVVASTLAEHYKTDLNGLPLSLVVSWFEQKAVAVLLSLLHLGVKNVRLGPQLPAFVSPNVLNVLVDKFNVTPVGEDAEADMRVMLGK